MAKRIPKTEFEKRLRAWQAGRGFSAKKAADYLEVPLATYRHWLYNGVLPTEARCIKCVEEKLNEDVAQKN